MSVQAKDIIAQLQQLNEVEYSTFQTLYARFKERRSAVILDSFLEGEYVTFQARGQSVKAKVTKVAMKNLKVVEVEVNGIPPSFPRKWTVAPTFCTKV